MWVPHDDLTRFDPSRPICTLTFKAEPLGPCLLYIEYLGIQWIEIHMSSTFNSTFKIIKEVKDNEYEVVTPKRRLFQEFKLLR